MSTINLEQNTINSESPGKQLLQAREKKGYTQEYVANKLHLRVKVIELLETDNYQQMPEPVFVKGYLRAYAKLLDIDHEPLLAICNSSYLLEERKIEKTLWQNNRYTQKKEPLFRWISSLFIISLIIGVGLWWKNNNQETEATNSTLTSTKTNSVKLESNNLTDISKMRSMLSTLSPMQKTNNEFNENAE